MSTEKRQPQVGDKMVSLNYRRGSSEVTVATTATVARITPTGIIVLDNETRLDPRSDSRLGWRVKGTDAWSMAHYRLDDPDDPQIAAARAATRRRNARILVEDAHNAWVRDPDNADLAVALRDRVNAYLLILEGRTPSGSNQ